MMRANMPSEREKRRIEKMLDEADDAMDRMDWDVVHRRATEVLALDPENEEAARKHAWNG